MQQRFSARTTQAKEANRLFPPGLSLAVFPLAALRCCPLPVLCFEFVVSCPWICVLAPFIHPSVPSFISTLQSIAKLTTASVFGLVAIDNNIVLSESPISIPAKQLPLPSCCRSRGKRNLVRARERAKKESQHHGPIDSRLLKRRHRSNSRHVDCIPPSSPSTSLPARFTA